MTLGHRITYTIVALLLGYSGFAFLTWGELLPQEIERLRRAEVVGFESAGYDEGTASHTWVRFVDGDPDELARLYYRGIDFGVGTEIEVIPARRDPGSWAPSQAEMFRVRAGLPKPRLIGWYLVGLAASILLWITKPEELVLRLLLVVVLCGPCLAMWRGAAWLVLDLRDFHHNGIPVEATVLGTERSDFDPLRHRDARKQRSYLRLALVTPAPESRLRVVRSTFGTDLHFGDTLTVRYRPGPIPRAHIPATDRKAWIAALAIVVMSLPTLLIPLAAANALLSRKP